MTLGVVPTPLPHNRWIRRTKLGKNRPKSTPSLPRIPNLYLSTLIPLHPYTSPPLFLSTPIPLTGASRGPLGLMKESQQGSDLPPLKSPCIPLRFLGTHVHDPLGSLGLLPPSFLPQTEVPLIGVLFSLTPFSKVYVTHPSNPRRLPYPTSNLETFSSPSKPPLPRVDSATRGFDLCPPRFSVTEKEVGATPPPPLTDLGPKGLVLSSDLPRVFLAGPSLSWSPLRSVALHPHRRLTLGPEPRALKELSGIPGDYTCRP